jgi:GNAT superfamily N-acetyltransferase
MEIKFLGTACTLHPSLRSQIIHINKKHFFFSPSLLLQAHHWWFAYEGDQVAAIAGTNHEDDRWIFMGPCGVLPPYRHKGIQRALIAAREEWARSHAYEVAVACTGVENYASANNLIKAGYHLIPPWKEYCNPDVGLFFKKQL